jgi:hypothetical protein
VTQLLESTKLVVDKDRARELLQAYRAARAPRIAEDEAIITAYREIARGRVVIQAAQAIRNAGWDNDGLPKLAMTRADIRRCECQCNGTVVLFSASRTRQWCARFRVANMPQRPDGRRWMAEATVPLIPLHLRPKASLRNYWILWEADWSRAPVDPLLLRRLSGDLWLVLAAWELTAVERAVLEQRVSA